ncbi:MAG: G1 family glutamic endopeptidase [Solirubrobacteraceae bacterium]
MTAACGLGAVPAASAAADVQQTSSGNWSGYAVGGSSSQTSFRRVSGSWIAPTASCSAGSGYSSFWVGLGGSGQSQALEQTGTEADCSSDGSPSYFAWYELVPSAPVRVNMTVNPGDHISSQVTVSGTNVTVSLNDTTTGGSFEKTLTMSNPDVSSAEWIAEAPSSCSGSLSNCSPLSLADFNKVTFTNASATTTAGQTGTIADFPAAELTLDPGADGSSQFVSQQQNTAGAAPSNLSSDGSSFSVDWSNTAASASGAGRAGTATSDPYGDGYGGYGGDPYGDGYGYGGDPYGGYGAGGGGYAYIVPSGYGY